MRLLGGLILLLTFADLRASWNALIEAERSFARTSITKGTREAFLLALANDSILFRPRAVAGKKWVIESPASTSQLSWEPEFADIASSGDLGYTTGPWELRRTKQDPPSAFGHYVTLWRKQASGEWKAELDGGIGHERVARPTKVDSPQLPLEIAASVPRVEIEKAKAALAAADKSATSSLAAYLADDARFLRDGTLPSIGKPAATKRLAARPGSLVSSQIDVKLSNSADLGYAYGTAEFKPQDTSKGTEYANYLRIWKKQRDGSWKIVLDMLSTAPKP